MQNPSGPDGSGPDGSGPEGGGPARDEGFSEEDWISDEEWQEDEGFFDDEEFLDDEEFGETERGRTEIADPLEEFNRAMFWFNDKLYFYALKPAAQVVSVFPADWRRGVQNAFYNIRYPGRLASCLLQGKLTRAAQETGRFLLNSTFGLFGLFNVAKGVDGLNPPEEDIGQAFGAWGIGHGFYLVLPFFGPSSLRDGVGMAGDTALDPIVWYYYLSEDSAWWESYFLNAAEVVNDTSFRLGDYEALKEAAIDPYTALKDFYLQYRARNVAE